jgi:chromosomal replication initiator protein
MKTAYKNRASFDKLALMRAKRFNETKTNDIIIQQVSNEQLVTLNYKMAQMIIETVCKAHRVCYDDLKSDTKDMYIVVPRQLCMVFIKKKTTLTLESIGNLFDKDHATVLHANKTAIPSWLLKPSFKIEYEKIEEAISAREKFIINAYKRTA